MPGSIRRRTVATLSSAAATLAAAGLVGSLAAGVGAVGAARGLQSRPVAARGTATPRPMLRMLADRPFAVPPTSVECELLYGADCYDPAQLEGAYNESSLLAKGDNGKGETIVIVDAYGSPTIAADLQTFDSSFKLPAPPKFAIIAPAGKIPPWTNNSTRVGWAEETSLDVEYSHAIAPGANILLVETPVAETEGTNGFTQIVKAEDYVISHKLGQVISQSFGSTEETFGKGVIHGLRSAYTAAQRAGVTVLAASGDSGATDYQSNGTSLYTTRVNSWPSSDPLVTSVGGLHFYLNAIGGQTRPAPVWNDTALLGQPAASGGGDSAVFARPAFQSSVSSVVGKWRGTPDVAMSASVDGGALVYMSAKITGFAGFFPIGGTSEASPEFAGIVAIADQVAGKSLGYLDTALYAMAAARDAGLVDIKTGNNTVSFVSPSGKSHTVTGYSAVAGYDMASGIGTVNAADFVPELVAAVKAEHKA